MPSIPKLPEPLSDSHVNLRFASECDIPEILIAYQDDPRLHLDLGAERPPSGAQLGRQLERADAEREAGAHAAMTILAGGSGIFRGQLNVHHIDWDHTCAELGVWLVPQARGKGLATHALRLAASWLFDGCALQRLQLLTDPDNEAMIGAAAGAGFVHEGVLREYRRERGRRIDLAILSLLPRDLLR